VSLADMVDRHVALAWPEAIALIAEVCRLVTEAAPTATPVPEASRLLVFADGSLRIGSWRGEMDLPSTARTLHDLLAGAQSPTPLRLFVGHAISSDKFSSVKEFGEALAYYERPGRTELIQSAFQRFLLTPADAPAPTPPRHQTEVVTDKPKEKARSSHGRGISRGAVAVVFLVVFAGCLTVALHTFTGGSLPATPPTLKSVSAQAATEVSSLQSLIRDFGVSLGIESQPSAEALPPSSPEPETPKAVAPRRVRQAAAATTIPPPTSRPVDPGPSTADVAAAPAVVPVANTQAAPADDVEAEIIYTSQSEGVRPPVVVDARVMPSMLSVSGARAQNRMELIIGTDGKVEQVRMLSALERLPDIMLLSGAKSWMFKPAMKDGRPVRYRLPMTWAVSPQ
jgi:hypothetical protein